MVSEKIKIVSVLLTTSIFVVLAFFLPFPVHNNAVNLEKIADSKPDFCFAVLGDTHTNTAIFSRISKSLEYISPEFVIINGDLTHYSRIDEYKLMYWAILRMDLPVFVNIGNHDVLHQGPDIYSKIFGDFYYSFYYNESKFIFLDSSLFSIDARQKNWLVGELSDAATNKFVVSHVPTDEIDSSLHDLFLINNVTAVIQSHLHEYSDKLVDGLVYIVTPSAGGELKTTQHKFGFLNICVSESGLKTELIEIDNRSIFTGYFFV